MGWMSSNVSTMRSDVSREPHLSDGSCTDIASQLGFVLIEDDHGKGPVLRMRWQCWRIIDQCLLFDPINALRVHMSRVCDTCMTTTPNLDVD